MNMDELEMVAPNISNRIAAVTAAAMAEAFASTVAPGQIDSSGGDSSLQSTMQWIMTKMDQFPIKISFFFSLAMVLGSVVPYVPQYLAIKQSQNTEGFSLYVCLTLLVANILRIMFWFGKPFDTALLIQSIVMIFAMFVLLELCVRVRNSNLIVQNRKRYFAGDVATVAASAAAASSTATGEKPKSFSISLNGGIVNHCIEDGEEDDDNNNDNRDPTARSQTPTALISKEEEEDLSQKRKSNSSSTFEQQSITKAHNTQQQQQQQLDQEGPVDLDQVDLVGGVTPNGSISSANSAHAHQLSYPNDNHHHHHHRSASATGSHAALSPNEAKVDLTSDHSREDDDEIEIDLDDDDDDDGADVDEPSLTNHHHSHQQQQSKPILKPKIQVNPACSDNLQSSLTPATNSANSSAISTPATKATLLTRISSSNGNGSQSGGSVKVENDIIVVNMAGVNRKKSKNKAANASQKSAVQIDCTAIDQNANNLMPDFNHIDHKRLIDFDYRYFWDWTDFISYIECMAVFTFISGFVMFLFVDCYYVVEGYGVVALVTESLLASPQFLKNFKTKSTEGMSRMMVFTWLIGDLYKTIYFISTSSPFQFLICGGIQITFDVMIFIQILVYKKDTYRKLSKSALKHLEDQAKKRYKENCVAKNLPTVTADGGGEYTDVCGKNLKSDLVADNHHQMEPKLSKKSKTKAPPPPPPVIDRQELIVMINEKLKPETETMPRLMQDDSE